VLQVLSVNQQVAFELQGVNLRINIGQLLIDANGDNQEVSRGFLMDSTAFIFTNAGMFAVRWACRLLPVFCSEG
jgi:hypothetical protein